MQAKWQQRAPSIQGTFGEEPFQDVRAQTTTNGYKKSEVSIISYLKWLPVELYRKRKNAKWPVADHQLMTLNGVDGITLPDDGVHNDGSKLVEKRDVEGLLSHVISCKLWSSPFVDSSKELRGLSMHMWRHEFQLSIWKLQSLRCEEFICVVLPHPAIPACLDFPFAHPLTGNPQTISMLR